MQTSRWKSILTSLLFVILCLSFAAPAAAQLGFKASGCATSAADVTLTTTAETVVVTSPLVQLPFDDGEAIVFAWSQLTTGGSTTAVTPRIRRGTTATGTVAGEANAETVKVAAGGTEPFFAVVNEQRSASSVQYSFTLAQTGAAANGSALQSTICVFVR